MRVSLVTLSGDPQIARRALAALDANVDVVDLPRAALEGRPFERLQRVRATRPDVFAVMTESLGWQYGQDALMLFGALAGASESVVVDSRGGIRRGSRIELLAKAPARIARCFARG